MPIERNPILFKILLETPVGSRVFLSLSHLAVGVLFLPVFEPVEVCWGFFFFLLFFLLQAVIFRCWPVKNGGCWRVPVEFCLTLDLSASTGLSPTGTCWVRLSAFSGQIWLSFEAVLFVSGRRDLHAPAFQFCF
jgi:hypothetical protein